MFQGGFSQTEFFAFYGRNCLRFFLGSAEIRRKLDNLFLFSRGFGHQSRLLLHQHVDGIFLFFETGFQLDNFPVIILLQLDSLFIEFRDLLSQPAFFPAPLLFTAGLLCADLRLILLLERVDLPLPFLLITGEFLIGIRLQRFYIGIIVGFQYAQFADLGV